MSAPDPTILDQAARWLDEGRAVALATVIETWGSAPQPVGSQLAVDGDGTNNALLATGKLQDFVACYGDLHAGRFHARRLAGRCPVRGAARRRRRAAPVRACLGAGHRCRRASRYRRRP